MIHRICDLVVGVIRSVINTKVIIADVLQSEGRSPQRLSAASPSDCSHPGHGGQHQERHRDQHQHQEDRPGYLGGLRL